MNKRKEKVLKDCIEVYKDYYDDLDLENMLRYICNEWRLPISLSMLLYLDESAFKTYCENGGLPVHPDDLAGLRLFREQVLRYMNGVETAVSKNAATMYAFDIEITGGICGCRIANPQNHLRFKRAIHKMFGKWDGIVNIKTYRYIYRQLNYAIRDEVLRRQWINARLPEQLRMPI